MISASIRMGAVPTMAAALFVLAARPSAAETEPYLVEYQAYQAALESGNLAGAATHGLAAWQAAEQALGDHRLTGILAYNYGRLVTFSASEQATAPLRRASVLQRAGITELPQRTLQLYLSYAEFAASGFEKDPADRLREALGAAGMHDEAMTRDAATMWLRLAASDFAGEEYRKTVESAAQAEVAIRTAWPESVHGLAEAILLGAVARIVPRRRTVEEVKTARDALERARRLFPPQEGIDNFDPLLAKILTWDNVASSILYDLNDGGDPEPGDAEDEAPLPPLFQAHLGDSPACGEIEWEHRTPPEYPRTALYRGFLGGVTVGYRLGEDLKIHDARVLAEVPAEDTFGEATLEVLPEWRAKALPAGGPECYRDLVMSIKFILET